MYPLFSSGTNSEVKEWKLMVDAECEQKNRDEHGRWNGDGKAPGLYLKRAKCVRDLPVYE